MVQERIVAATPKLGVALVAGVLIALVVGLVGGIIWYNFQKSSTLAVDTAQRLLQKSADAAEQRIAVFYEPVIAIVALGSRVPEITGMNPGNASERLDMVMTGLRRYPQLFSLYVGFDDGSFDMVTRIGGAERSSARKALGAPENAVFAHEVIRVDAAGKRTASWTFLDEHGATVGQRPDSETGYDPRQRQWFHLAKTDEMVHRSDPYIFASSQEIGITLSRALEGGSGGVFGADLAVQDVSRFLSENKVTDSSIAFLFNDRGEVIAYPDDSKINRTVTNQAESTVAPTTIASLGRPELTALYEAVHSGRQQSMLSLKAGGREYLVEAIPVLRQFGETSYLGMVAPVDEITAPIDRIRSQAMFYSIAILLLILPLYVTLVFVWIERRLGRQSEFFIVRRDAED